jgi:hypothetical protein
LTKGLHSDLEKAEALYDFVAKKVKYLSLMSLGVGGYMPSSANEVLRKGTGDCKDKVILLAALLEAEGMHASSVLINPNRELEPEVPSPWPFTHVITMLPLGNEKIWMDPSSAVLPFRTLSPLLLKKQGLVMPPEGAPHFEETPKDAPVSKSWLEKCDGRMGRNGVLNIEVKDCCDAEMANSPSMNRACPLNARHDASRGEYLQTEIPVWQHLELSGFEDARIEIHLSSLSSTLLRARCWSYRFTLSVI